MPIQNPTQLVDEFKKSGEFDRLRRQLLSQFQKGDGVEAFMARVDDIARQKLNSDQRMQFMQPEAVHRELLQEMERYPLVERAVADLRVLSDPSFSANIRKSVRRLLRQDRGQGSRSPSPVERPDLKDNEDNDNQDMEIDSHSSGDETPTISRDPPVLDVRMNGVEPPSDKVDNVTRPTPPPIAVDDGQKSSDEPITAPVEVTPDMSNPRDVDATHVIREVQS
ncbi:hypothetical protein JAAARDRAFT_28547 [Jaapia argillacea MUCL 33604]|uniref:BOD1/SHG1 domain-containing protein n=1 Tax=Jaapia argillacea MUCL 33604 TaxID=933084 RepID=A0A067QD52_9AGAM|nr:hypothetical protein JAAARDRAFT_28547 [Jaapia argillacea MUCL 33604]